MEEFRSRSILDYTRTEEESDLCRFILIAGTTFSSEEIIEFFGEYAREHFADRVTGLMLVYPNYIINLFESTENEIFQVCSYMTNVQPRLFDRTKYFLTETNVEERFFEKWYSGKIVDRQDELETVKNLQQNDLDGFEKIARTYGNVRKNLYIFFRELREAKITSPTRFMEKLNELGRVGNRHLPGVKMLRDLLENPWGKSLESLLNSYYNEISSRDIDEEIWPFPEYQYPPIDMENI